ncbi:hypothetical protein JG687_00009448 [Phytophthora cactorum]|uniref:Uncharacterized protein n=1 Tax=Phytophthora cactorum TaxID=29920 RepID=A0A8T1UDW3_9STRA|nr:hypothetical protein JG687_00009448 [Phytophthora cactorum]
MSGFWRWVTSIHSVSRSSHSLTPVSALALIAVSLTSSLVLVARIGGPRSNLFASSQPVDDGEEKRCGFLTK